MAGIALYRSGEGRRSTWAWVAVPLAWLFIFIAARLSDLVAGLVGLRASGASGRWQDNIAALFAWGAVLLILWLWLRFWEHRRLDTIGLAPRGGRFAGGLAAGGGLAALAVAGVLLLGGYAVAGPGAWYDHLTPVWLFASSLAVAGTVVQATVMEALFRGWMMQTIAGKWGGGLAIAVNVIAFAVIEAGDIRRAPDVMLGAVNLALLGLLLSLGAMRANALWGVCGLHAGWVLTMGLGFGLNIDGSHLNVTPLLVAVAPQPDAPWFLSGGDFGPDGSLIVTAMAILFLLWRMRGPRARRRDHDDDDIID